MDEGILRYYILFDNYEQGLALHELLDANALPNRIAPAPRCLKDAHSCGMSLLIEEKDIDDVKKCLESNKCEYLSISPLRDQIRSKRDRYC